MNEGYGSAFQNLKIFQKIKKAVIERKEIKDEVVFEEEERRRNTCNSQRV